LENWRAIKSGLGPPATDALNECPSGTTFAFEGVKGRGGGGSNWLGVYLLTVLKNGLVWGKQFARKGL